MIKPHQYAHLANGRIRIKRAGLIAKMEYRIYFGTDPGTIYSKRFKK